MGDLHNWHFTYILDYWCTHLVHRIYIGLPTDVIYGRCSWRGVI